MKGIDVHLEGSEHPKKVTPEGQAPCEPCPKPEHAVRTNNLSCTVNRTLVLPVCSGPLHLQLQLDYAQINGVARTHIKAVACPYLSAVP